MKTLLKILKISIIICLVVIFIDTLFKGIKFRQFLDPIYWGVYFFYCFVLTLINSTFFSIFGRKIGWENANLKKVFFASGGSIVLTMIGFFFCRMVDETIFQGKSLESFLENEHISYYLFPLLFTTIVSLFFHLVYFYKALQEKEVKEQKIIAGTASAKFEALKNQLDPHFLFNSLNVLSSLIEENPMMAQKFTGSLSKIYRYVLEKKDKELVSLEEELKFARIYAELLQVRFEEGLVFNIPENVKNSEAKIVPLSLQLLLENTIKHNRVSKENPLIVSIYEEGNFLIVENNLQAREILNGGSGVGLKNITQRYALVTERKLEILKTKSAFKVRLPLLTKKVREVKTKHEDEITNNAYLRAREQVKKEKGFYGNLIAYLIVIPALAVFNYLTVDFVWVIFPAIGWGLGLALHAVQVFDWNPFLSKEWEERKIKEIIEKEHSKNF
ncbi:histidine kinase [Christiangramia fulva]|uniref:Histidine kinase n=1 Tax=Christiangramia fulva TaxID=2126553 RepID=A0A2R3Z777_9FLAO|nr:2TM domain-containing protein [Christiangramia fulva]AVR46105.1 histidine kinase [Christiangramia fulva]